MKTLPLVAVEDYDGLHCVYNSPLASRAIIGMNTGDVRSAGVTHDRMLVHKSLIGPLNDAQEKVKKSGYTLTVIDGWHPYLAYDSLMKRSPHNLSSHAQYLIESRIHSTGLVVNVLLWDTIKKCPVPLAIPEDGEPAFTVGFYKLSTEGNDADRVIYRMQRRAEEKYRRQQILICAMLQSGFVVKPLNRVCHFEFETLALVGGGAEFF